MCSSDLINRGSQHGAAMFFEPYGIVGASTKKRDPERCAADNHCAPPLIRLSTALHIAIAGTIDNGVALDQFADAARQRPFRHKSG